MIELVAQIMEILDVPQVDAFQAISCRLRCPFHASDQVVKIAFCSSSPLFVRHISLGDFFGQQEEDF
jgi:hypothetical protein